MTSLHLPWLEAAILIPLFGSLWVRRFGDSERGLRWWLFFSGITFLLTIATWLDFSLLQAVEADDRWRICELWGQQTPIFVIDHLSAPMLPWLSLLFFLTAVGTLQAKVRRFSFSWKLLSEGIALSIFSCKEPWILIGLLAAGTVPPFLELRARGKPTRIFLLHMALYIGLLVMGETFVEREAGQKVHSLWATLPLLIAVLVHAALFRFTFGSRICLSTPPWERPCSSSRPSWELTPPSDWCCQSRQTGCCTVWDSFPWPQRCMPPAWP